MRSQLPAYIIVLFLITLVLRIILIPYYDYNLGGIEPNVIYGIQRILQGQPLYQDPAAGSYAVMQYTPLYYHFVAWLAKLLSKDGLQHGLDVHALYTLCRTVSLIFNLLTVLVCAFAIRSLYSDWYRSVVFALPVLIIVTAHYYTRGDSMQLFFFAAAICIYIILGGSRPLFAAILTALFTSLCIATKQSGILCFGIITSCLLFIDRRYMAALIYLLLTATFTFFLIDVFVQGSWLDFYRNTVLGLKNGFDPSFLYKAFIDNHFLDTVPCYILCGVLLFKARPETADRNFRILLTGAILSWLFAMITGLKIGSSNNYFTEFLLFAVFVIAYLHNAFAPSKQQQVQPRLCAFASASLLILVTSKTLGLFTQVFIDHSFKNNKAEYENELALRNYFINVLQIKEGEHIFFTERYFLDNLLMPYAIMPTKDVTTQVYFANSRTFDYSAFVAGMNRGAVKYIVTSAKRNNINVCSDSLPFIFFGEKNFRFVTNVSGWCIFCFTPPAVMVSS